MTKAEMERRLLALEEIVEQFKAQRPGSADPTRPWWRDNAGRFANDPVFDEIVRLGREY